MARQTLLLDSSALGDPGTLARTLAQVVKPRAPHPALADQFNMVHHRGVQGKVLSTPTPWEILRTVKDSPAARHRVSA